MVLYLNIFIGWVFSEKSKNFNIIFFLNLIIFIRSLENSCTRFLHFFTTGCHQGIVVKSKELIMRKISELYSHGSCPCDGPPRNFGIFPNLDVEINSKSIKVFWGLVINSTKISNNKKVIASYLCVKKNMLLEEMLNHIIMIRYI